MRAFVTGGTAGIGAACVARLTADGHTVAFTGRNAARGVEVASRTGATFLNADITDRAAADQALARAVETLGGLDAVVANAGILSRTPLTSISGDEMWTLLETNLTAQFRTSRAAWPHLVAAGGGSIALIGSDTSIRGSHRVPAYSVVKAGTVMLSDMLAADGAAVRIRANAVCPGNTLPGMAGDDPATWPVTADGLQVTAEEIASCVGWLLSAEAVHVTGATIRIDGGIGAAFIPPPA